jgi:P27 family predicted phage terminase small subunit
MSPPYELSEEAAQVWVETVDYLKRMGIDSPADANALVPYCVAVATFREADRLVRRFGLLARGGSGVMISKAVLVRDRAARDILRYAQEFGFTPSARTRVDVTHPLMSPQPRSSSGKLNPFDGSNLRPVRDTDAG